MIKPQLVIFEGPDGSGKSTLVADVSKHLSCEHELTRAPGGSQAGEELRGILANPELPLSPLAASYLFFANHVQMLEEILTPAAKAGKIVLTDRLDLSTIIFQGLCYRYQTQKDPLNPIHNEIGNEEFNRHLLMLSQQLHRGIDAYYVFVDAQDQTLDKRLQKKNSGERFENLDRLVNTKIREQYRGLSQQINDEQRAIKVYTDGTDGTCHEDNVDKVARFIETACARSE